VKAGAARAMLAALLLVFVAPSSATRVDAAFDVTAKVDPLLQGRRALAGRSRAIVRVAQGGALPLVALQARLLGGRVLRTLPASDLLAIDLPNASIAALAAQPLVSRLSLDRFVVGATERTGATVGSTLVRQQFGIDGAGVGVAVIDSGITQWHNDLANASGSQRVAHFVDFVSGRTDPHDDYGHGTHVAGIVAGNGADSGGARAGIAPGVHLVVLKVLDGSGRGRISDVIAALDYAVANKDAFNIRVVNLSVATGVYESYDSDPLTLAARRAVSAGIVVVTAAGNNGRGPQGQSQYGGVTAPGNAPWVLTVGASSHMGTAARGDDSIAQFSSRGPGAIDYGAKPDIVSPGVGIESLADPFSSLYASAGAALLNGTVPTSYFPYMSLSGSSMAAPVATGTIALMLQANPALTPNAVKAILQYTAESADGHDFLTQGAGFLNAKGAIELARHLADPATRPYPDPAGWSQHLIWGNHLAQGGRLGADANAWSTAVTWGDGATSGGTRIRWGLACATPSCTETLGQPWQTACANLLCTVLSGERPAVNVVWGPLCAGVDCPLPWTAGAVTATSDAEADTVVWGTSEGEGETVVWGTRCADPSCEPVIWGNQ
jgi:serine protease AprX